MILINAVTVGISTFVITFFMLYLDGPFDIFLKLRTKAKGFFEKLYNCFYCFSTWICLIITALYAFLLHISVMEIVPVFIVGIGISSILNMLLVER